jgi:hypothetical protein
MTGPCDQIVVSPADTDVLYATNRNATSVHALYVSQNRGDTARFATQLPDGYDPGGPIGADPSVDGGLFIAATRLQGGPNTIFHSTDFGEHFFPCASSAWTGTPVGSLLMTSLGALVLATSQDAYIAAPDPCGPMVAVTHEDKVLFPRNLAPDDDAYAVAYGADGVLTMRKPSPSPQQRIENIHADAVAPGPGAKGVVAFGDGFARVSLDHGHTWVATASPFTMAISTAVRGPDDHYWVGTATAGPFAMGASFVPVPDRTGFDAVTVTEVVRTNTSLYAVAEGLGIYRKTGTDDWVPVNDGLPSTAVADIDAQGDLVYAVVQGGVYQLAEPFTTWTLFEMGAFDLVACNPLDPSGEVYAYSKSESFLHRLNAGPNGLLVQGEYGVRLLITPNGTLLLGTSGPTIFTTAGGNFHPSMSHLPAGSTSMAVNATGVIYATSPDAVSLAMSTNDGENWSLIDNAGARGLVATAGNTVLLLDANGKTVHSGGFGIPWTAGDGLPFETRASSFLVVGDAGAPQYYVTPPGHGVWTLP